MRCTRWLNCIAWQRMNCKLSFGACFSMPSDAPSGFLGTHKARTRIFALELPVAPHRVCLQSLHAALLQSDLPDHWVGVARCFSGGQTSERPVLRAVRSVAFLRLRRQRWDLISMDGTDRGPCKSQERDILSVGTGGIALPIGSERGVILLQDARRSTLRSHRSTLNGADGAF